MSEIFSDPDINDNQNLEDLDSCLGYLKKREVFLYKMMNDPDHKAMLYFLEVLLNSEKCTVQIDDLAGKFYCKNFTQDMRDACGNNSYGLKKFLERYPALFCVNGNYVSAVSLEMPDKSLNQISNCSSPSIKPKSSTNSYSDSENFNHTVNIRKGPVKFDINKETEAVKFFQNKLLKRDEKWVPIKSLAGHLSQANPEIRDIVGPQLDFKKFLIRNPQIFEIQGELVSLRDPSPSLLSNGNVSSSSSNSSNIRRGKSLTNKDLNSLNELNNRSTRPKSLNVTRNGLLNYNRDNGLTASAPTTPVANNNNNNTSGMHLFSRTTPISMTSSEYRALMFLRKVIEKKNNSMSLSNLFICLGRTKESIRNVIGWTKFELQEFIRKNSVFFDLTPNEVVVNRRADRINVIITGASSNNSDSGMRTLTNRSGTVFHVAKLWGIIDLGKHEHVFFDKSIFKHLDDLQRHFKIGEVLYFNAILAPKESRAKWRATQVWKECDREMVEKFCGHVLASSAAGNKLLTNGTTSDGLSDIASILTEETSSDDFDRLQYASSNSESINDNYRITRFEPDRLLPAEVEEELTRILKITRSSSTSSGSTTNGTDDDEEDPSILANYAANCTDPTVSQQDDRNSLSSIPSPDISCSHRSIHSDPIISKHPLSAPIISSNNNNSQVNINSHKMTTNQKNQISANQNHSFNISTNNKRVMVTVSTQTLSTGDIMATNLYHE